MPGMPKIFFRKYKWYIGVVLFFILWMLFFDEYNVIRVERDKRTLKNLKVDNLYYKEKIKQDKDKLYKMRNDPDELERFAREQYHLKKPNEEVFIIVEE